MLQQRERGVGDWDAVAQPSGQEEVPLCECVSVTTWAVVTNALLRPAICHFLVTKHGVWASGISYERYQFRALEEIRKN